MSAGEAPGAGDPGARLAAAEQALRARDKTIHVLMQRVQDQQTNRGSALALLEQNTRLQQVVSRKTAELEERADDLADSLSVLNAMLESTTDGILVFSERGGCTNCNGGFMQMWGLSPELMASQDCKRIVEELQAQVCRPETFLAVLQESVAALDADAGGLIELKDGRMFKGRSQPLLKGTRQSGRVWSFRDVTKRTQAEAGLEQSESKFRALVEHSLVGVYVLQDGRFSYVNPRLAEFFGYSREEIVKSMAIQDLVAEEDRALVLGNISKRISGEIASTHYVFRGRRKDGSRITVEVLGSRTTFAGEPAIIGTLLEITERIRNERLALRSQRLEAIGTLAGGVAHDLNNALAPIMMGVEMLRQSYPGESEIIDMFSTSARRGADLVKQLLTFSKGAEGERVILQPALLIKGIQKFVQGSFPKGVELAVRCDPNLPTVSGDATQLDQVLLNLCVNARDAMPHGGRLTLEALQVDMDAAYASTIPDARPGSYVALRVSDTGTGIPPDILDRIFEPFFTTKDPEKGTGLGLSTVIGIVKGHGGFLQVYSYPGKGSIFTAFLPASSGASERRITADPFVEFRGLGESILVVDDEPTVRAMARTVLRRLNFEPLTAIDGPDGLIKSTEHRATLRAIVTDMHMPHMDGLGYVRALRRILPDIPVIVASGRLEESTAGELKALGVTVRLDKPFTEAQLAGALRDALSPARG